MDVEEDNTNRKLLLFANQLKAGRGLTMTATLIEGDVTNPEEEAKCRTIKDVRMEPSNQHLFVFQ